MRPTPRCQPPPRKSDSEYLRFLPSPPPLSRPLLNPSPLLIKSLSLLLVGLPRKECGRLSAVSLRRVPILKSTPDLEEFCKALCGFHARLALIVQGLDVDEVYAIGCSCCPSWKNRRRPYKKAKWVRYSLHPSRRVSL